MKTRFAFLATVALFTATSAVAANVYAGNVEMKHENAPVETVRYSDLDLSTPVGVRTLYKRIDNAAWKVCRQMFPATNGPSGIANSKCRSTLVDAAVKDANRPTLTALHMKRNVAVTARR
jgi:UrcA family protein